MSTTMQSPSTGVRPATVDAGPKGWPDETLIATARALGPIIREHADQAERERRLAKPVLEAIAAAGLQRMLTPGSLGGLETDPVTCARVIEEVASFDSAAGWALQPGNSGGWWSARMPDEGVEEIYGADPNALMAASFHPPQQAVEVAGGYRVTGRGPLASNIHDSDWVLVSALVMQDGRPKTVDGMPDVIALVMRTSDVEILDTWYPLGMRGTDSNDIVLEDVFVPAARTYRLLPTFEPGRHYQGPLYRFPVVGVSAAITVPVLLALARAAITELRELAAGKTPFGSMKTLRDRTSTHVTLAEAEAILRSARSFFYDTLATAWTRTLAGEPSSLEHRADLLLAGVHAVKSSAKVTDLMHGLAGTTGIYERNRLARLFRDAHTLRHHGFVSEGKLETVGQIYLGLPPEFVLVAF